MGEIKKIETDEFEKEVLKSDKPVVVDFWAEWCRPCKKMEPLMQSLWEEFKDQIKFLKLDVDENPSITAEYGVRGIPTLFLFKDGQIVERVTGVIGRKELIRKLKKLL